MAKIRVRDLPVIDAYKAVLDGEIKKLPNNFWSKDVAKELILYVMESKDLISRDKICSLDFKRFLRENNLVSAYKMFECSPHRLVTFCFPEFEINEWELKKCPNQFWLLDENRLKALKWFAMQENIDLDNPKDAQKITAQMLHKYFGSKILSRSNNSVFELLDLYYHGKYKEWEVTRKMSKWTFEKGIDAVKWLVDEVYHWSRNEVCDKISVKVFADNGLDSMLNHLFRHSPLIALQAAYPNENYTKGEIKSIL